MAIDTNIKLKQSRYENTRRRITRFRNKFDISDREIIESLAEEIEEYRNRIENQNKIIDELSKRTIQSEEVILDTTDELIDKDVTEIISTTVYADGKVIKATMEYKYKDNEINIKLNSDSEEDWTRYEESN